MIKVYDTEDFNRYIEELLKQTEGRDLEFKSAAGGFPGSFWDTYSAFANSEGGTIVLGVAEKKGTFHLDDLTREQVEKYAKDFWNNVNNRQTVSCNLLRNEDVKIAEYKGHTIMLFDIPQALPEQRPVYRTTQPYNGTFKRNHEGDYKCTEREVQRMFADANVSSPVDSRILKNYSFADIDTTSLKQYRQLFSVAKPDHPWLALDDKELLTKLGGYRIDRETNEEGLTMAALLMFGRYDAIIDPVCCPDFFPDYQERLDANHRWTNRIYPDGTWECNIFQFYRTVLPKLQNILPKPFVLEGNIRKEETSAHVAVREALTNCLIHADYTENASLSVTLYKNKMVFSNPGTLLVSKRKYYDGGESVCRNKSLQKMFMMLGTAEKAGSGVDKIVNGWRANRWKTPRIEQMVQPDKCQLTMVMDLESATDTLGGLQHNEEKVATIEPEECNLKTEGMQPDGKKVATLRKRMTYQQLSDMIVKNTKQWKSREQLTAITGKQTDYLRNKIIPRMLEEHLIEMMYPGTPNHPSQKYRAKE